QPGRAPPYLGRASRCAARGLSLRVEDPTAHRCSASALRKARRWLSFASAAALHATERATSAETIGITRSVRISLHQSENLYADEPSTFGRVFSAKSPRQIQIMGRFAF